MNSNFDIYRQDSSFAEEKTEEELKEDSARLEGYLRGRSEEFERKIERLRKFPN